MTRNDGFFREKKAWSIFKDKILDYYLRAYVPIIQYLRTPILIIDCFAGPGKFEDGKEGSPLIIGKIIKEFLPTLNNKQFHAAFIEKKYHKELANNIVGLLNCKSFSGTFEEHIDDMCAAAGKAGLFIYVDPYGINSLNMEYFRRIKGCAGSNSIELFMNFNSLGFLREGCRVLKYIQIGEEIESQIMGIEVEVHSVSDSMALLNSIAGGEYWQSILLDYNDGKISINEAETRLVREYKQQLSKTFKFVIDIPIYEKTKNLPKYRLIFCTDNKKGFEVMFDTMSKFWQRMIAEEKDKENQLFSLAKPHSDLHSQFCDPKKEIINIVSSVKSMSYELLLCELINKYGVMYSKAQYREIMKEIEKNSILKVSRVPAMTKTGKPSQSWDFVDNTIQISI